MTTTPKNSLVRDRTIYSPFPDVSMVESDIWSYLRSRFEELGNKTAFIFNESGKSSTYKEVNDCSLRIAAVLKEMFPNKSPTAAIFAKSMDEYPMIVLGTLAAGGISISMFPEYPLDLVEIIIKKSEIDVIIFDDACEEKTNDARSKMGDTLKGIHIEDIRQRCFNPKRFNDECFKKFRQPKVMPDDPCFIFFTSGTTGTPKAIVHSHRVFLTYCLSLSQLFLYAEREYYHITSFPFPHLSGTIFNIIMPVLLGCPLVMEFRTDFECIKKCLTKYPVHMLPLRPWGIQKIIDDPAPMNFLSKTAYIATGGLSPDRKAQVKLHEILPHIKFLDLYGSTEIIITCMSPKSDDFMTIGTIPVSNATVQVRDLKDGKPLGPNEEGLIVVKTPFRMIKYVNDDEATKKAFYSDGYFITGDVGYYTEDGRIIMQDRQKDIIYVNGKKVIPSIIENILLEHPNVREAYVVGIPDANKGQTPKAYVKAEGNEVTEAELIDLVNSQVEKEEEKLGENGLEFKSNFVKTALGKVSKKHLRGYSWKGVE